MEGPGDQNAWRFCEMRGSSYYQDTFEDLWARGLGFRAQGLGILHDLRILYSPDVGYFRSCNALSLQVCIAEPWK